MKREVANSHPTLTDHVSEQLLEYIQTHNLGGGEELPTEAVLVELLQVSRVSLREALCKLKALGIVTSRRGSGLRVSDPDLEMVLGQVIRHVVRSGSAGLRGLFELRRKLELGCIGDAVEQVTVEELRRIEKARLRFEEAARAEIPVPAQVDEAEADFHEAITAPARCAMLDVIGTAIREFFRLRTPDQLDAGTYKREHLEAINLQHRLIADSFRVRSPEAAYFALRNHLSY